jgi:prevent-host-death family protein
MTISLTEDFKTLAELRKDLGAVLGQVHRTGRPVVITKEGKPNVVILDAAVHEQRLKTLHLGRLLAEDEMAARVSSMQRVSYIIDSYVMIRTPDQLPCAAESIAAAPRLSP